MAACSGEFVNKTGAPISDSITSILPLSSGDLWIECTLGGRVLHEGNLTRYTEQDGFPLARVRGFATTPDGTLWAATMGERNIRSPDHLEKSIARKCHPLVGICLIAGDAHWTSGTKVWFVMIKDDEGRYTNSKLWGDGWAGLSTNPTRQINKLRSATRRIAKDSIYRPRKQTGSTPKVIQYSTLRDSNARRHQ
jgi:hypothetical protein